jgi:hypothetical protein
MDKLNQIKTSLQHEINKALNWVYANEDDYGTPSEACGDFVDHFSPKIQDALDEAYQIGLDNSKKE